MPDPTAPPGASGASLVLRALTARWTGVPAAVKAAAYMLTTAVLITCMHAIIRHVSATQHPFEIAFFRSFFGLLAFSPVFLRYGRSVLRTCSISSLDRSGHKATEVFGHIGSSRS